MVILINVNLVTHSYTTIIPPMPMVTWKWSPSSNTYDTSH